MVPHYMSSVQLKMPKLMHKKKSYIFKGLYFIVVANYLRSIAQPLGLENLSKNWNFHDF